MLIERRAVMKAPLFPFYIHFIRLLLQQQDTRFVLQAAAL